MMSVASVGYAMIWQGVWWLYHNEGRFVSSSGCSAVDLGAWSGLEPWWFNHCLVCLTVRIEPFWLSQRSTYQGIPVRAILWSLSASASAERSSAPSAWMEQAQRSLLVPTGMAEVMITGRAITGFD